MGSWGTGLYSDDEAADLKSTIGAIARLPFTPDQLLEVLCKQEAELNACTFWLVVADQFWKRGIQSERATREALKIIREGRDLERKRALGMTPSDLKKRSQVLDELADRLQQPVPKKPRTVLKKPQPLLFQAGDLVVYPTCDGRNINPYMGLRAHNPGWAPNDWGALVIAETGLAYGYLAWYRPIVVARAHRGKAEVIALAPLVSSISGNAHHGPPAAHGIGKSRRSSTQADLDRSGA